MTITIEIPDNLAPQLTRPGQDLGRAVLEAMAVEAYRMHRLTGSQLRHLLGIASRYELDGFLKARKAWLEYTLEDMKQDRETHRKLGL